MNNFEKKKLTKVVTIPNKVLNFTQNTSNNINLEGDSMLHYLCSDRHVLYTILATS